MSRLLYWRDPGPAQLGASGLELLENLNGPGVISVAGRDRARSRVVITLSHGNEPSGLHAVHSWLRSGQRPAVNAVFVIASVAAALHEPRFSHRMLPDGRDLNRCFAGPFDDREGAVASAILDVIADAAPECVIDVHNNTGHNPAYAIATRIAADEMRLASLFGRRFVHSDLRIGSLMEAVTAVPCVTVECGRVGDPNAERIALEGIEKLFAIDRFDAIADPWSQMEIFESLVRVRAREDIRLAIGREANPQAELTVLSDIDRHNFSTIAAGTHIGWATGGGWPIEARDASGRDRSTELFTLAGGVLQARIAWTPIMMTTDPVIAQQDCLFYIVARRGGGSRGAGSSD